MLTGNTKPQFSLHLETMLSSLFNSQRNIQSEKVMFPFKDEGNDGFGREVCCEFN